jgi:hypothetical protein
MQRYIHFHLILHLLRFFYFGYNSNIFLQTIDFVDLMLIFVAVNICWYVKGYTPLFSTTRIMKIVRVFYFLHISLRCDSLCPTFFLIDHNLTITGFEQQSATKWLNINNRGWNPRDLANQDHLKPWKGVTLWSYIALSGLQLASCAELPWVSPTVIDFKRFQRLCYFNFQFGHIPLLLVWFRLIKFS